MVLILWNSDVLNKISGTLHVSLKTNFIMYPPLSLHFSFLCTYFGYMIGPRSGSFFNPSQTLQHWMKKLE